MWNVKTGAVVFEKDRFLPRTRIETACNFFTSRRCRRATFFYYDGSMQDQQNDKALARREGREQESSSEGENQDKGASSSKDHQLDIVPPQTIKSGKHHKDVAYLKCVKCPTCFTDNLQGSVHCDSCGHLLISNEQTLKDQDKHIAKSKVVYDLEVRTRMKPTKRRLLHLRC